MKNDVIAIGIKEIESRLIELTKEEVLSSRSKFSTLEVNGS